MKKLTYFWFLLFISSAIPQQNYNLNEIRYEGDNIIIPESRLEEFLRFNKPHKNNPFYKQYGEYRKDGFITSALTQEPLEGIEAKLLVYDFVTLFDTIGPILTNSQGYYTFTITGVNGQKQTTNIGQIKYHTINTPTIELQLNKLSKVEIILFTTLGEEVKTLVDKEITNESINTDIENLASGVYILQTIIDGKTYINKILKTENRYGYGKTKQDITEETTKNNLGKVSGEILVAREFRDPNNLYHKYWDPELEPFAENISKDFTLVPRIQLDHPITDPEYTTIPNIQTLRDLKWYSRRVLGEWDNKGDIHVLWPIKLHIDTTNAPTGWKEEIRNVIQFYQDSLNIHPDSLIKENPTYIQPAFSNGFSSMNIIYTDSNTIGQAYGVLEAIISSSNLAFIGGNIYLNTQKINNTTELGTITARQIQKYTTQTIDQIKDERYLGNTTNTQLGNTKRPNNDEKKWIKIGRFSSKPTYINRIYP